MALTRVTNVGNSIVTLAWPYAAMIGKGKGVTIADTKANILAAVPGLDECPEIRLLELDDSESPTPGIDAPPAATIPAGTAGQYATLTGVAGVAAAHTLVATKLLVFLTPAAAGVGVHAAWSSSAGPLSSGFTNPAIPRVLEVTFSAAWDGGVVTVTGTDQFGNAISDTFTTGGSGDTIQGNKCFATVTGASKVSVGAGLTTATIKTGAAFGLGVAMQGPIGVEILDDTTVEAATFDPTNNTIIPGTAPNGTHSYVVLVNVNP